MYRKNARRDNMQESKEYLSKQILTYLGNKRSLLNEINKQILLIKKELNKDKIVSADLFSGSGIVSRLLKQHSSLIYSNDLELYSYIINKAYLGNLSDFNIMEFENYKNSLMEKFYNNPVVGIISNNYCPSDDNDIKMGERVFFTRRNALFIDTMRFYIDYIPDYYRTIFLAQLLVKASIHTNTSGVFKGFYKDNTTGVGMFGGKGQNALNRIMGDIIFEYPVFSNFNCESIVTQKDAEECVQLIKDIDITYLDPPYNQHPYGSNYFMLNLIANNELPKDISKVSGIPKEWNRSNFNKNKLALPAFESIIKALDSKYIIVSYNNEGFISFYDMFDMLSKYGDVTYENIKYNTFRGSRNLNSRDLYTNEFIFVLRKN